MVSTALCTSYFCFLPFWAQSRIAFPGPLSVGHYPSTSSGQRFEWNPLSLLGFPGGSVVKNMPVNAEVLDLITGSGRSPGEGNGNLLQYSCLGNFMDREAWQATVHGAAQSRTWLGGWARTHATSLLGQSSNLLTKEPPSFLFHPA